jgi:hypothetical protein
MNPISGFTYRTAKSAHFREGLKQRMFIALKSLSVLKTKDVSFSNQRNIPHVNESITELYWPRRFISNLSCPRKLAVPTAHSRRKLTCT